VAAARLQLVMHCHGMVLEEVADGFIFTERRVVYCSSKSMTMNMILSTLTCAAWRVDACS